MFGHDNQTTEQNDQASAPSDAPEDTTGAPLNVPQLNPPQPGSTDSSGSPIPGDDQPWQHPGEAIDDTASQPNDVISPAGGFPQALSSKEPVPGAPAPGLGTHGRPSLKPDDNQLADATNENLIEVKEKALNELFPLIDKLDQKPDEHFRTLMMIIQASDNHTLIEKAYQVAQTIDDEKARAQALLDIVNEINYFTQQPEI